MNETLFNQLLELIEKLEMECLEKQITIGELQATNLTLSSALERSQLSLQVIKEMEAHDALL